MDKTCSWCRPDVDDGVVLCTTHGMTRELLEALRDALPSRPENMLEWIALNERLRDVIAKASAQEVKP